MRSLQRQPASDHLSLQTHLIFTQSAAKSSYTLFINLLMERPESSVVVPRTYCQQSRAWNIIFCGWALLMATQDWWPVIFAAKKPTLHDYFFSVGYVLLASISTLITFRSFVCLSEDSITVSRVWGSKVLPFNKIKGRRRYTEKADPYSTPPRHIVLESNDDQFLRIDIKLGDSYKFDEDFYRWFDSLTDLDRLDGIEEPQSKYANFSLV